MAEQMSEYWQVLFNVEDAILSDISYIFIGYQGNYNMLKHKKFSPLCLEHGIIGISFYSECQAFIFRKSLKHEDRKC